MVQFSSVQFSRTVVSDSLQLHGQQHSRPPCPSPTSRVYPNSCSLNWWCHPTISSSVTLFSFCLQPLPALGFFPNVLALCIRWPKYWCFSFSINSSNEYSKLISLNVDWFDLLAIQGTLTSHLQHHSSKTSILWHSAFFTVQFLQSYMTTGKMTALTIWISVGKVMSLLFNTLSRFVIAFLTRGNCLLILWLQSPSSVILGPQKRKSVTASPFLLLFAMK